MTSCCEGCTERRVGCHNAATCEKWAAHEREKNARYAESRARDYYFPPNVEKAMLRDARRKQRGRGV